METPKQSNKIVKTIREWSLFVEKKWPFGILGLLATVLFGLLALPSLPFFQKTNPNLRMEVVSSANVIDVKEDVGNVEIRYEGVNLRETQQTLALVTLKISNDGAAPIRKSDYDDKAPLGIAITNGNIAKVELFGPSNAYIRGQMKATVITNATFRE